MKKIIAIIQSRMGSTRLPGKSLASISDIPLLEHVVNRVRSVKSLDDVIVSTSDEIEDSVIENLCKEISVSCFRGSQENVLDRFYNAAKRFKADVIIRICGDNPFISTEIIEKIVESFRIEDYDFVYGIKTPLGCSSEGFTFSLLESIFKNTDKDHHKEHIVTYIMENINSYKVKTVSLSESMCRSDLRFTVDTREDLELIRIIYKNLFVKNKMINLKEVIEFIDKYPHYLTLNENIKQKNPYSILDT